MTKRTGSLWTSRDEHHEPPYNSETFLPFLVLGERRQNLTGNERERKNNNILGGVISSSTPLIFNFPISAVSCHLPKLPAQFCVSLYHLPAQPVPMFWWSFKVLDMIITAALGQATYKDWARCGPDQRVKINSLIICLLLFAHTQALESMKTSKWVLYRFYV